MRPPRNQSVDTLKFIAAFGVIIIHLAPSTELAEKVTRIFSIIAVPFFLFISLHFFFNKTVAISKFSIRVFNLDRLLVPYLIWSIIYSLMRYVKYQLTNDPNTLDAIGVIFFGQAAVHLYFVPLLVAFQAIALVPILILRSGRYKYLAIVIFLSVLVYSLAGTSNNFLGFNNAIAAGIVYAFLVFIFRITQNSNQGRKINFALGCLISVMVFTTAIFNMPLNLLGFAATPVVGYGLSALTLNSRFVISNSFFQRLLTCSYGIYLSHFAFLEIIEFGCSKLNFHLTPYTVGEKFLLGLAIFTLSVLFTMLVRKNSKLAYLLLGERILTSTNTAK